MRPLLDVTANIAVNKQRIKQFANNTVFLKNGDEYEIELYNGTPDPGLGKISIDGSLISNTGIVIRPGERIFLDRFIDMPNKLKFSTYEVDKNINQAIIANNGEIKIHFYGEAKFFTTTTTTPFITYHPYYTINGNPYQYYTNATYIGNVPSITATTTTTTTGTVNTGITNLASVNYTNTIETGRTELGSKSDTNFTVSHQTFNSFSFKTITWNIKPKQYEYSENLNVYCTGCGAKRKKQQHKFCSHRGTKF
jgi:hypothetical protein